MKKAKRIVSLFLAFLLVFTTVSSGQVKVYAEESDNSAVVTDTTTKTESQKYVEAMSPGWNLGNSLDAYDTNPDKQVADIRETAWGNPVVVQELFANVKAQGFNSVRIPITFEGCVTKDTEGNYIVDQAWLTRIKEVVDMAMAEDLYVMINVHHDSWIWLSKWDGQVTSEEYIKFCDIWEQFAPVFKEYGEKLSFETINEPNFSATGDMTATDKLDVINKAAYDIIRASGANNSTRMIVLPTLHTNHEQDIPLYDFITKDLNNDPNVIATMHYYSEWVYSANLGITGFDEKLWDTSFPFDYTPRTAINVAFDRMYNQFTANGIGVVIGEYGLLGYDSASEGNQPGEELKYYEYVNEYARQKGITLMFWDNGSGLDRKSDCSTWKKPVVGEWLKASMVGRSSTAVGLDTIYLKKYDVANETTGLFYDVNPINIPLSLNGNTLVSISDQNGTLVQGEDYTYDEATATVTLTTSYVQAAVTAQSHDTYGTCAALSFTFSSGAHWYQNIVKCTNIQFTGVTKVVKPEYTADTYDKLTDAQKADDKTAVKLHVNFNGNKIRRATAYGSLGRVGPNSSWWKYLQYSGTYIADYADGSIRIYDSFFADSSVPKTGKILFQFEMYNGDVVTYAIEKTVDGYNATTITSNSQGKFPTDILIYAGETSIPNSYLSNLIDTSETYQMVYGWGTANNTVAIDWNTTVSSWLHPFSFATTQQELPASIGGKFSQYLTEIWYNTNIWVKNAPVVHDTTVYDNETPTIQIDNLIAEANPVVTYQVEDPTIATVDEQGKVTGLKVGTTNVAVTVTQYGRTDTYNAKITVKVSAYIEKTNFTLFVGESDTFNLVNIADSDYKVDCNDQSVVKVEGNKITALATGTAKVTVYYNVNGGASKQIINVRVLERPTFDSSDRDYFVGELNNIEVLKLDESAVVKVESSNTEVAEGAFISLLGENQILLLAKTTGTTTITVSITEFGRTETVSFDVTVQEGPEIDNDNILPMFIGDSETITVSNIGSGTFTATSDDESVAIVENNTITAVGIGSAYIEIEMQKDGKTITDAILVEVLPSPSVDELELSYNVGDTDTVKVSNLFESAYVLIESSDTDVVDVQDDHIIAKSAGQATLFVTVEEFGKEFTFEIQVTVKEKTPITVSTNLTMFSGNTQKYPVSSVPGAKVTAVSSNVKVAKVNNGVISAVGAGTATVTVTTVVDNRKVVTQIKVTVKASTIKFTQASATVNKGKTTTYKAALSGVSGKITYTSSNPKVASVNATTGVVKGLKAGSAVITATFSNGIITLKVSKTIKVEVPTTSLTIQTNAANKSTLYIVKGKSYTLGVDIKPVDVTSKTTFKSSNTSVATVSSTGKITALKTGTTKITVTSGAKSQTITVKVVAKAVSATKVSVETTKATVKVGNTYTIKATVSSLTTTDRITYTTSNSKVATVDKYGNVTAKKAGKATITVTVGKKSVKVTITVK